MVVRAFQPVTVACSTASIVRRSSTILAARTASTSSLVTAEASNRALAALKDAPRRRRFSNIGGINWQQP